MNIKRCIKNISKTKAGKVSKLNGGVGMGVSMGIIKPMEGKVAQDFLRDSKKSLSDKDAMKKCKELARMMTKRY